MAKTLPDEYNRRTVGKGHTAIASDTTAIGGAGLILSSRKFAKAPDILTNADLTEIYHLPLRVQTRLPYRPIVDKFAPANALDMTMR